MNPEDPLTIDDASNWEVVSLQVNAVADAYLDKGRPADPEQLWQPSGDHHQAGVRDARDHINHLRSRNRVTVTQLYHYYTYEMAL